MDEVETLDQISIKNVPRQLRSDIDALLGKDSRLLSAFCVASLTDTVKRVKSGKMQFVTGQSQLVEIPRAKKREVGKSKK